MKKIVIILLAISVLTSFITQTIGSSGLLARITLADLSSLMAGFLFIQNFKIIYNKSYQAAFLLFLVFSLGIFVSGNREGTLTELLVLVFLISTAVMIYSVYRSSEGFVKLIHLCIYASLLASLVAFYAFLADIIGLPQFLPQRATGEILSGFRNAGQAGAYALVMLTILMPFRYSSAYKLLDKRHQFLLTLSVYSTLVFLFLTGKIAAYIGFIFCLLFSAIQKRKFNYFFILLLFAIIVGIIWQNLDTIAPDVYNRISGKIETRVTDNLSGEVDVTEEGFLAQNLGKAIHVFLDKPLFGSGIGGFYEVYGRYEVHSTYFKLLGETGLAGTVIYIVFMTIFFSNFKDVSKLRKTNPYASYLWNMLPFLYGCLISWGYTYHLRKREFWILFSIVVIAGYLKKNWNKRKELSDSVPADVYQIL